MRVALSIAAAAVIADSAAAADFARIEERGDVRAVIASEDGESFFQAENVGAACRTAHFEISHYGDLSSGGVETFEHAVTLAPHAVGKRIYLRSLTDRSGWVSAWSLDPQAPAAGCSGGPGAVDRDTFPVWRRGPDYPLDCMYSAEETEHVTLRYLISERGEVRNARVLSSTNACLESAALAALGGWLYAPALQAGRPVKRTYLETTLTFRLTD